MKTIYKLWINDETKTKHEWFFEAKWLAEKFMELKLKEYNITPDSYLPRGHHGISELELLEGEEDFYKNVLR